MKTTFKIGNIEIQGVKLDNIEVTQEYTAIEAINLASYGKKFVQELIKDLPEIFDDLERAQNKFEEIDERLEIKQVFRKSNIDYVKAAKEMFDTVTEVKVERGSLRRRHAEECCEF